MFTIKTIVSRAPLHANRVTIGTNMIVLSASAASKITGVLDKSRNEMGLEGLQMFVAEFHSNANDDDNKCDSETEKQKQLSDIPGLPYTLDHHSYNIINEDIYIKHKVETYNLITSNLTKESFSSDEEKYQTKTSKIIEIFYSLDESNRPKELRAHDIDYMVKMKRPALIRNFVKKLARTERSREKNEEIRSEIREAIMSRPKDGFGVCYEESGKPAYRVHGVSPICSWAACKRIRQHLYTKIAQSKILNAQKVVIDFDYNDHMTLKEHLTITAQIKICIGSLRKSREPVDLYFCNFDPTSPVARLLELDFGPPSSYLVEATSKSYFDLFPREKLVYLTADTDNVLQYDPDDIYIIGGMIDAQTNEPVSAAKAEKEGLRTAKLHVTNIIQMAPLHANRVTIGTNMIVLSASAASKITGVLDKSRNEMGLEGLVKAHLKHRLNQLNAFKNQNKINFCGTCFGSLRKSLLWLVIWNQTLVHRPLIATLLCPAI
uniref:SAM-dependent MTase TRM10-type domain-containing protein n=1 Tax=Tetranychus urticae TaxID=32264 RepID=T1KEM0_TETUR